MSSEYMVSEILNGVAKGFMQGQEMGFKQREQNRREKESALNEELKQLQIDRERSTMGQETAIAPGTSDIESSRIMARRRYGKDFDSLTPEEQRNLEDVELKRFGDKSAGPKMSFRDMRQEREFAYKKGEDLRKRKVKLFGKDYYTEFDASEAKKIRTQAAASDKAVKSAGELYKMAMNPVKSKADPRMWARAQSLSAQLKGQLRLAVIGPGAMSDQERKVLDQVVSDPTSVFSLPAKDREALKTLMETIKIGTVLEAQARGVDFNDKDLKRIGLTRESVDAHGSFEDFNNRYPVEKGWLQSTKELFGFGDEPKAPKEAKAVAQEKFGAQNNSAQLVDKIRKMMAADRVRGGKNSKEDIINMLLKKGRISQSDAVMLNSADIEETMARR